MHEEEAKTKWCPMLQVSAATGVIGTVSNRSNAFDDNSDRHGRCIGSACMAWRWADVPNPDYAKAGGGQHFMQYPPPVLPPMYLKSEDDGFCGLAGKP